MLTITRADFTDSIFVLRPSSGKIKIKDHNKWSKEKQPIVCRILLYYYKVKKKKTPKMKKFPVQ